MIWTDLPFGKHLGKTLPQVLFTDPDWFFWAHAKGIFRGRLAFEADELFWKATHIRIPQAGGKRLLVEYALHPRDGKLASVKLVPESCAAEQGGSPLCRRSWLDMSMANRIAKYDKTGAKILIDAVKEILFGNAHTRMTAQRCAAFFENEANFLTGSTGEAPGEER